MERKKIVRKTDEVVEVTKKPASPPITENDGRLWYKKVGGGRHRIGNMIIKPGQKFLAYPHEISDGFKDVIICIEPEALQKVEHEKEVSQLQSDVLYKKVARGKGWFDVVNIKSGKPLNSSAIRENVADELLATTSS